MPIAGIFYLTVAALTYGLLHVVDKAVLKHGADPATYTILRVFFAAAFLSIFVKAHGKHHITSIFRKTYLKDLIIIGVLTSGIGLFFQIKGLSYSSATNVSLILTLVAPVTSFFAFFYLKEEMTLRLAAASLCMLIGVWSIYFKNDFSPFGWGDALIVLAIISFACGNVHIRKTITNNVPTSIVTLGRLVFGTASLVLLLPLLTSSFEGFRQAFWLMLLGGAVFGIRMAAYHKGIELVGASKAATFLLLSPVVSVFSANFFLNEPITQQILTGIVFVLVGAFLLIKPAKTARNTERSSV